MTQKEESQERPRRRRRSKAEQDQPAAEAEAAQGEDQPSNGKAPEPPPPPRLLQRLREEIGPQMTEEFSYKSPMQIPTLEKVVLNIGLGEALLNARAMEAATGDLTMISGQKPVITRAKKSIAGFKIREGMAIGVSVTLRGRRMYEFMDRLLNSALPRIRDFQGVPRESFDGRGNFSLGIREQVIFPEIDYNSIDRIRGLQVAIVTTARNDQEGFRLLELLGMPFARTRDALAA
ncbi:MAG: 50S ribosomal protein L5 [SAR202 cluster bacterium]|jgi:large subunit ribosomal protein L5|nr:50S ribosomal protein L5 [Chloroflexota bacterium]MQG56978.1 50S ribosomal protein L5 [SAR202 cluster bacterium]MQG68285.1 50S ribosomal protein L5 [SAR202 cluster bacterium]HAL48629.1 50S ribosomal protein L5 [Dehalococcoidia bacterium]|tara:strand:- start:3744 stop:4445 length:702 start_codon:yes stop_codon:yes gene_type:complete